MILCSFAFSQSIGQTVPDYYENKVKIFDFRGKAREKRVLDSGKYKFTVIVDGRSNSRPSGYNFRGIPFGIFISRDGKILWMGHPYRLAKSIIEKTLNSSSSAQSTGQTSAIKSA